MSNPAQLSIDEGSRIKLTTEALSRFRAGLSFLLQPPESYPVLSTTKTVKGDKPISLGGAITALDFHASGSWLATATDKNQIHLFDCVKGNLSRTMNVGVAQTYTSSTLEAGELTTSNATPSDHIINQLAFTHHATALLYSTTSKDDLNPTLNYASMHDFAVLQQFAGHRQKITSIAMNPCHDSFITSSKDRTIRLWDLRSSKCQGLIRAGGVENPLIAIDPMGLVLAIAARDNCIKLFDLRQLDNGPFGTFYLTSLPLMEFHSIRFSTDGSMLLVNASPLSLEVQNTYKARAEKKYMHSTSTPVIEHDDFYDEENDSMEIVSGDDDDGDHKSKQDDNEHNSNKDQSPESGDNVDSHPNFTLNDLNYDVVLTIDAFNGQLLNRFSVIRENTPLTSSALKAIGADSHMVELTRYLEEHPEPPSAQKPVDQRDDMDDDEAVSTPNGFVVPYSLSADGKYMAMGSQVGTIPLYDARNGKSVTTFTHKYQRPIQHIRWNPTRTMLVTIDDREMVFWVQSSK